MWQTLSQMTMRSAHFCFSNSNNLETCHLLDGSSLVRWPNSLEELKSKLIILTSIKCIDKPKNKDGLNYHLMVFSLFHQCPVLRTKTSASFHFQEFQSI